MTSISPHTTKTMPPPQLSELQQQQCQTATSLPQSTPTTMNREQKSDIPNPTSSCSIIDDDKTPKGKPEPQYEKDIKISTSSSTTNPLIDTKQIILKDNVEMELEIEHMTRYSTSMILHFKDPIRNLKVKINDGEFDGMQRSKKNNIMNYYPTTNSTLSFWSITFEFANFPKYKLIVTDKLLPKEDVRDWLCYPDFEDNHLVQEVYNLGLRIRLNQFYKPSFKIFLSHSSLDKQIISDLYFGLTKLGYDCFYDIDFVQGISTITRAIDMAIRESHIILLLITPDSVTSSWVKNEIDAMKNKYKLFLSYNCNYDDAQKLGVDIKQYHIYKLNDKNLFHILNKIDSSFKKLDYLTV